MTNILTRLNKIESLLKASSNMPPYSILTSLKINGFVQGIIQDCTEFEQLEYKDWQAHRLYALRQAEKSNQNTDDLTKELDIHETRIRSFGGFRGLPIS